MRAVIVWAGVEEANIIMRISDDKRWSSLEHFSVVKEDIQNGLFRLTEGEEPKMYVVAPDGVVDAISKFLPIEGVGLREKLTKFINLGSQSSAEEERVPALGEKSWRRFMELFHDLPALVEVPLNATMTLEAKYERRYNREVTWKVEPLSIDYEIKEGQVEFFADLQKKIIQQLDRGEYALNATV